jgi:fructokinase
MFTCFGEVLWDVFPDREKIGGAPLNVAFRLHSFKAETYIISSRGNDRLGEKLTDYAISKKFPTKYIQVDDNHPTGRVNVTLDDTGSATYEIEFPTAWDHIQLTPESVELVKRSEVFLFGSLICRNSVSRNTLFELLKYAAFKVFDVNLRPPYFSSELLQKLMTEANFIKFNEEELELITKDLGAEFSSLEENMSFISNRFKAEHVCVTKGDRGAVLLIKDTFYHNSGYKTVVKDTVGAGDSFLGTLVYKLISNDDPQEAIDYACAVGAIVTSREGANPDVSEEEILRKISG